ncbi:MAG: sulfatase-like hydrolase/transferase [Planctomycetes bacterium]|nr:sulfatase-like hydrolase/transferase [Planctomycetota bacterium]
MPTRATTTNQPVRELFCRLLRRITTFIFAGASLSHSICPGFAASLDQKACRPNIVLILADDLGYSDLRCYGHKETIAPEIDRLAKEGVRCTQFYVTWPACTPSRASLLTGRYPQRNGLYDMIRNDMVNYGHRYTEAEYDLSPEMTLGMDERERTLAEVLKTAGYTCGVVGKWDGGRARRYLPLQRGFDFFYGFANTGIDYWTHQRYGIESMFRGNERIEEEGYSTDLFGREAVRFIRESKGRPFFLYVPFNAPHGASNLEKDSYQAPPETLALYKDRDPKDKQTKYMAMVTRMDERIGDIRRTIEEIGAADNTLIVFTSDNGGSGNIHNVPLRGQKSTMFEGGLRVPMIAWWPKRLPAGAVNNEFLTSLEWLPTLATVAGVKPDEKIKLDGFDMLPVLAAGETSPRTKMFWERRGDRAARVGNWKWVASAKGGGLFDLAADVSEKHDLSAERPEVVRQMEAEFAAWRQEMDAAEPRGPFRDY